MIRVDDPDDPRIDAYRDVRDRDLKGRDGLFMAEGELVLRTLVSGRSRFHAESVLLGEARSGLAPLVRELAPDVPVYLASRRVMEAVAGFPIHRGVLAVARRVEPPSWTDLLAAGPALILGLVGISNHDNVGGAFRNAAAFGARAVLLDGACCDPLYRKAVRVSVGAALTVPFRQGGAASDLIRALREAGFYVVALSPTGDRDVASIAWPPRTALLVGAEGPGLARDILESVPTVAIRMAPGFDSLNVATAAGIALHTFRAASTHRPGD